MPDADAALEEETDALCNSEPNMDVEAAIQDTAQEILDNAEDGNHPEST